MASYRRRYICDREDTSPSDEEQQPAKRARRMEDDGSWPSYQRGEERLQSIEHENSSSAYSSHGSPGPAGYFSGSNTTESELEAIGSEECDDGSTDSESLADPCIVSVPDGDLLDRGLRALRQGVPLYSVLNNLNETAARCLYTLLTIQCRPPSPRQKLPHVNKLQDVLDLLQSCKKILIITGAGVSVSCGIPDFRSENGIYARLRKDFPDLPSPQSMFDINFFASNPLPFFKFAREIYPGQFEPSPCHKFIRMIEEQGKLMRNYTQNIDTLEQEAGISRVIQCHGSFATASCRRCKRQVSSDAVKDDIFNQVVPHCTECSKEGREAVMKPDIVFFGENLHDDYYDNIMTDKSDCDLLIVIGSSLKVQPVCQIPYQIDKKVPQILINREPLTNHEFDVELLGSCDVITAELCHRLGWGPLVAEHRPLKELQVKDLPQEAHRASEQYCVNTLTKSLTSPLPCPKPVLQDHLPKPDANVFDSGGTSGQEMLHREVSLALAEMVPEGSREEETGVCSSAPGLPCEDCVRPGTSCVSCMMSEPHPLPAEKNPRVPAADAVQDSLACQEGAAETELGQDKYRFTPIDSRGANQTPEEWQFHHLLPLTSSTCTSPAAAPSVCASSCAVTEAGTRHSVSNVQLSTAVDCQPVLDPAGSRHREQGPLKEVCIEPTSLPQCISLSLYSSQPRYTEPTSQPYYTSQPHYSELTSQPYYTKPTSQPHYTEPASQPHYTSQPHYSELTSQPYYTKPTSQPPCTELTSQPRYTEPTSQPYTSQPHYSELTSQPYYTSQPPCSELTSQPHYTKPTSQPYTSQPHYSEMTSQPYTSQPHYSELTNHPHRTKPTSQPPCTEATNPPPSMHHLAQTDCHCPHSSDHLCDALPPSSVTGPTGVPVTSSADCVTSSAGRNRLKEGHLQAASSGATGTVTSGSCAESGPGTSAGGDAPVPQPAYSSPQEPSTASHFSSFFGPKVKKISIAEFMQDDTFVFIPPNRYVFKDALVYNLEGWHGEDSDDEDDLHGSAGHTLGYVDNFSESSDSMTGTSTTSSASCRSHRTPSSDSGVPYEADDSTSLPTSTASSLLRLVPAGLPSAPSSSSACTESAAARDVASIPLPALPPPTTSSQCSQSQWWSETTIQDVSSIPLPPGTPPPLPVYHSAERGLPEARPSTSSCSPAQIPPSSIPLPQLPPSPQAQPSRARPCVVRTSSPVNLLPSSVPVLSTVHHMGTPGFTQASGTLPSSARVPTFTSPSLQPRVSTVGCLPQPGQRGSLEGGLGSLAPAGSPQSAVVMTTSAPCPSPRRTESVACGLAPTAPVSLSASLSTGDGNTGVGDKAVAPPDFLPLNFEVPMHVSDADTPTSLTKYLSGSTCSTPNSAEALESTIPHMLAQTTSLDR